ncbi:hypothetical protein L218DRAFT_855125, partial [Marasmius fiardii PR-910]
QLVDGAVINEFANTLVTALYTPEWGILLQRIGRQAMTHLLTMTSIFVSLPNGCLCQMTGKPFSSLPRPRSIKPTANPGLITVTRAMQKRKAPGPPEGERPQKRVKMCPRGHPMTSKTDVETTKYVSAYRTLLDPDTERYSLDDLLSKYY